jgi:hypothetical protein
LPAVAIFTLKYHAKANKDKFPLASETVAHGTLFPGRTKKRGSSTTRSCLRRNFHCKKLVQCSGGMSSLPRSTASSESSQSRRPCLNDSAI